MELDTIGSRPDVSKKRVLIHWCGLPEYAAACIAALRLNHPVQTLVLFDRSHYDPPFDMARYPDLGECIDITATERRQISAHVEQFKPHAALVGGWIRSARVVAWSAQRLGSLVVAGCDNQFRGTWKQRLLPVYYQLVLRRMVDFFLVPGERARNYLLRSGVLAGKIWTGLYSVDVDRFAIVAGLRKARSDWPRSLLFVGQYVERKGVPELLKAFSQHSGGWKLVLCGAGPLKGLIANYCKHCPNIIDRGFVQPADLPAVMAEAGAFILPSREDNWPLVLIEAGAAGLPLICSRACGSSGELVREGVNGFLLESVNVQGINELILKLASMSVYGLREMGAASAVLVSEYSAVRWAQRLWSNLSEALPTEKSLRNASHSSGFSKIW